MSSKIKSPAKKLRNLRRLFSYNKIKSSDKSLSIKKSLQKLSTTTLPSINLIPETPKLSTVRTSAQSVSPRLIYHPAIINASLALHQKHPSQLSPEEIDKFNMYRRYKIDQGQPIEEELMYLPSGGLRNCMQCGHLT